jgi:hypothetical protein
LLLRSICLLRLWLLLRSIGLLRLRLFLRSKGLLRLRWNVRRFWWGDYALTLSKRLLLAWHERFFLEGRLWSGIRFLGEARLRGGWSLEGRWAGFNFLKRWNRFLEGG